MHTYNQCIFACITYGMVLYIKDSIPTNTNIEQMYVYASERSERAKKTLAFFTFLNCYFFQYFVGTSDTLSVQMTCLSVYMYRQISKCTDNSEKALLGGGGGAVAPSPAPPPPPPPSGSSHGEVRKSPPLIHPTLRHFRGPFFFFFLQMFALND